MDLLKVPRFPYKKNLRNKGHLTLETEVLKEFSRGAFNSVCLTHSKMSNNRNLEPKSDFIYLFYLKLYLMLLRQ